MWPELVSQKLAGQVTPRALRTYALGLGLEQLVGVNGKIAVYHKADDKAEQLIVPLDTRLDDYAELVAHAVSRLAGFESRSTTDILDHLLLPPADMLQFRDTGVGAADGTLSLDQAANFVTGIKKALLSQAHSVLKPQAYHPRLGRGEAEQFVDACRFGQTRRGSFAMTLACPLNAVPTEGQLFQHQSPFARQVTSSFMQALAEIAGAAQGESADELLSRDTHPLINANLCEALVLMKPEAGSPLLEISASWSRAARLPDPARVPSEVRFDAESFAVAEYIAPLLRAQHKPEVSLFVGYVDILRGDPGPDGRPLGEVVLSLLIGDESLRARAYLSTEDYATAASAHLGNAPVLVRGELHRLARLNRLERIESFRLPEPSDGGNPHTGD